MDELTRIKSLIYEIRGVKVMLDKDLADLYHVTTGNLNKAVKSTIRLCHGMWRFHFLH